MTEFVCPECGTTARTQKQLAPGTQVRCPSCKAVFGLAAPPPPKPKTAVIREVPDSPPPARAATRSRDDDDDRPRRRRKPQKSSNGAVLAIVAVVAVLLIGVGGLVIGIFAFGNKPAPTFVANPQPPNPNFVPPPPPRTGLTDPLTRPPSSSSSPTKPESSSGDSSAAPATPASSGSVQDVYHYVLKSTVLIVNLMQNGAALGTGSVIDANERLILTNFHVVANTAQLIVFFPTYDGGKLVSEKEQYLSKVKKSNNSPEDLILGDVLATDTQRDLALIRVPKLPPGTEALPLAKGVVNIGQTVHSVGNPGASGALWVYTQGAVRSIYRKKWKAGGGDLLLTLDAEVVETQSPTNHGDSGGPLVNDRGELVGVTEGGSAAGNLISVFISLSEARDFIEREFQRKYGKAWSPVARAPLRLRGGGGADVTALINALDNKDAKSRASAARSLGEMGPDAKLAIRRLIKALKDPDELTARAATEALAKIGAPGRDDLSALLEALKDPKPEVRRYVSAAIGQIGPEAASAAPQLVDALADTDEQVRESLARSLGSLGPSAKSAAVPGLTKTLQDNSKSVRVAGASGLANLMTPPTADDVPLAVSILKQQDPEARVFGARVLAKLGKQAKAAIPDLLEAAKSADAGIRREAIDSLAAIGPDAKTAAPLYVAALKDASDSGVRQSALHALGQIGKELDKEKDKETIAAVVDAIKDSDPQVKKAALSAAGKLGAAIGPTGAKLVMTAVIEDLQNKDTGVRDQALETIAGLGPLAKDAITPLITMMEKPDFKLYVKDRTGKPFLQEADDAYLEKIAKTLGKIGAPAIGQLVRSLRTTNINFGLFIGSCRALGEIGPPARQQALETLQQISNSPILPPPVCEEADRAMRKIRAK